MYSDNRTISDLENLISEKICIKIENWNLYLGDAGLSRKLAIECLTNLSVKKQNVAKISLSGINVQIGNGDSQIPLLEFITASQINELESILEDFI